MNVFRQNGLMCQRWSRRSILARTCSLPVERRFASIVSGTPKSAERQRVVILGSGWAGYVLSRKLDTRKYVPIVVSPRSYFVFTPLLNDAAVGTLEFRAALEPVRRNGSGVSFVQGWAEQIDFANKTVTCEPCIRDPDVGHALTGERTGNRSIQPKGQTAPTFKVHYDKLVVAVGCSTQTFGVKGVKENAMFLKDVGDARRIRRRILEIFEWASQSETPQDIRNHLLHFAIVGGGPTGMEFGAQLSDLIRQDLSKLYPELIQHVRISLYDVAPKVLPMFDASLVDYAIESCRRQGIDIKTSYQVEELRRGLPNGVPEACQHSTKGGVYTLRTKQEGDVGVGMCVWSTGNTTNPFIRQVLDAVHEYPTRSGETDSDQAASTDQQPWIIQRDDKSGNILVDDSLRVKIETESKDRQAHVNDVWCIGDVSRVASGPLPATAQVANQQAIWLAKNLNKSHSNQINQQQHQLSADTVTESPNKASIIANNKNQKPAETFTFKNLGIMTYIGGAKALLQSGSTDRKGRSRGLKGLSAFLMWRAAYLTMILSWRNKILVPSYWIITRVFGRDISRF